MHGDDMDDPIACGYCGVAVEYEDACHGGHHGFCSEACATAAEDDLALQEEVARDGYEAFCDGEYA